MIGLPGEYVKDGVYDWSEYIHPEDRERYESVMEALIGGRRHTYDIDYRVRMKDGTYNFYQSHIDFRSAA